MLYRPSPIPVDPERVAHFAQGPECVRSGCHRTATRTVEPWRLCDPCADAVERTRGTKPKEDR